MVWVLLLVTLLFVMLFYLIEYIKSKQKFNQMTEVDGQLLSYQLNAKSKRINPYDMHHTSMDLEQIFTDPEVLYSYRYNNLDYQSSRLSLLGAVKTTDLNAYLGPKPMPIKAYINPNNPNQATLHLGRFSRPKLLSALLAFFLFAYMLFKYVS